MLHYVQVIIRLNIEYPKHLVQHLAMLSCDAHNGVKFSRVLLELFDQGAHFNGLGPGSENEEDCFHRYSTIFLTMVTAALPSPKRGGKATSRPESTLYALTILSKSASARMPA